MKKLKRIETTKEENKKLKVAEYCRVSTKFESQQSSIDLQISNYETLSGNMQEFILIMVVDFVKKVVLI